MPTADDYWRAAADFEARGHSLREEAGPVSSSVTDDVVTGGRLRTVLDEAIDAIVQGIGATAAGFDALAAECRRRAVACEQYTVAVEQHRRSLAMWTAAGPEVRAEAVRLPAPPRAPWMRAG